MLCSSNVKMIQEMRSSKTNGDEHLGALGFGGCFWIDMNMSEYHDGGLVLRVPSNIMEKRGASREGSCCQKFASSKSSLTLMPNVGSMEMQKGSLHLRQHSCSACLRCCSGSEEGMVTPCSYFSVTPSNKASACRGCDGPWGLHLPLQW